MCVCVCVCVCVFVSVFCLFRHFFSIACFTIEELSLIASNQQIYKFYRWVVFETKIHCGKQIFDISELLSVIQRAAVRTCQVVLIYIYWVCQSIGPWVCCVSLWVYVFVISNQSTSKIRHFVSDLSKLGALWDKIHISYYGTKTQHV